MFEGITWNVEYANKMSCDRFSALRQYRSSCYFKTILLDERQLLKLLWCLLFWPQVNFSQLVALSQTSHSCSSLSLTLVPLYKQVGCFTTSLPQYLWPPTARQVTVVAYKLERQWLLEVMGDYLLKVTWEAATQFNVQLK